MTDFAELGVPVQFQFRGLGTEVFDMSGMFGDKDLEIRLHYRQDIQVGLVHAFQSLTVRSLKMWAGQFRFEDDVTILGLQVRFQIRGDPIFQAGFLSRMASYRSQGFPQQGITRAVGEVPIRETFGSGVHGGEDFI